MSPIGRIFSVLNLVLAVWFLAWAANTLATGQDYKTKWEEEKDAKQALQEELEGQIAELRTQRDQAQSETADFRSQRDQAQNEVTRLEAQLAEAEKNFDESQANLQALTASIDALKSENTALQQSKEQALREKFEAEKERDDALAAQQEAEGNLADAQARIASLEKQLTARAEEIASLERQIEDLNAQLATVVDITGVDYSAITAQPQIDGYVTSVVYENDLALIAINKGADAGVKPGFTFDVYNGGVYKGRVRVQNVHGDFSTALVERPVAGQRIETGDSVTTRL